MGIIQTQTVKGSIFSYTGVLLGFITTGLLLPNWFSLEENGVIKLLAANAAIFGQLATLGFTSVTTRLFTYFRHRQSKHHGFLGLGMAVSLTGSLLAVGIYFLLKDWLLLSNAEADSIILGHYIDLVIPMIAATVFFHLFDNYYKVLYNAVKGTLYKEVYQRIFILLSLFLFFFDIVDFKGFVWLYVFSVSLPTLMLMLSLLLEGEIGLKPDTKFLTSSMQKEIFDVGLFGIIVGFSNIAILNIDSIMVNKYLGLSDTGIYGITFFFGTLVIIPSRMVKKISAALLADAWKDRDMNLIQSIYAKSSINQLILGALILIGIWGNIDNVFHILPDRFLPGTYVILLIALSNLIEMGAGVSGTIISISPHYRYMSHFMIVLLVLIVISNMIFIPLFGLIGAALASLISYFVFVLLRFLFLYKKYKMQPFGPNHLKVLGIAVVTYLLQRLIPQIDPYILDIAVRSIAMTLVYAWLCAQFRVSEEYMNNVKSALNLLKGRR